MRFNIHGNGCDILDGKRKQRVSKWTYGLLCVAEGYELFLDLNSKKTDKHHATIIHAYRSFEDLVSHDRELQSDYDMVKANFMKETTSIRFKASRMRLVDDAIDLKKQNKKLTLQVNELMIEKANDTKSTSRY